MFVLQHSLDCGTPLCRGTKAKTRQALRSGEGLASGPNAPVLDPIPNTEFDLVHIVPWERDIIWDQQDESEDQPQAVEDNEWADFDKELGFDDTPMQQKSRTQQLTSVPVLEPLPSRPATGESLPA